MSYPAVSVIASRQRRRGNPEMAVLVKSGLLRCARNDVNFFIRYSRYAPS